MQQNKRHMKTINILLTVALVFAIPRADVKAQTFTTKAYKLSINGTSSLHDWESAVDKMEARGSFVLRNNSLSDIRDVAVQIPVKAIKSPKGKLMDNEQNNFHPGVYRGTCRIHFHQRGSLGH
jgi:hypothetical protein